MEFRLRLAIQGREDFVALNGPLAPCLFDDHPMGL